MEPSTCSANAGCEARIRESPLRNASPCAWAPEHNAAAGTTASSPRHAIGRNRRKTVSRRSFHRPDSALPNAVSGVAISHHNITQIEVPKAFSSMDSRFKRATRAAVGHAGWQQRSHESQIFTKFCFRMHSRNSRPSFGVPLEMDEIFRRVGKLPVRPGNVAFGRESEIMKGA